MRDRTLDVMRVGISSCLLGEAVRFDGGHKHDRFLSETLGQFFEWVPVCPEMELGLGAPRESLRLVGSIESPRIVGGKTGEDHTDAFRAYSESRLEILDGLDLCGYILKSDSPSCGMERVRVYGGVSAPPVRKGVGLFARALLARFPLLPVEEEGRLHDNGLRENFIERVFAYRRIKTLNAGRRTKGDLVRFHTTHKYLILSHSPPHYQEMGRLVAQAGRVATARLFSEYERTFMVALAVKATRGKHANVLHHLLGFLKEGLSTEDRAELVALIDDYRRGLVPLIVPLTLLKHHLARTGSPWAREQIYLNPHPKELMLRNHV